MKYQKKILEVLAQMKSSGNDYVSFPAIAYKISPELERIEEQIINMGRLDKVLPSNIQSEEDKRLTRLVYIDTPKVRQERRKLMAKRRGILVSILHSLWSLEEEGYLKVISTDGDLLKDEADLGYEWYITDKIMEEVR